MGKQCPKCKTYYDNIEQSFFHQTRTKDGYTSNCKSCFRKYYDNNIERKKSYDKIYYSKNVEKMRLHKRKYRELHPDRNKKSQRTYRLKKEYGLSDDQYNSMLELQNFSCAICGFPQTSTKNLGIDHDHNTGKIRGLLCDNCNVGLGNFQDNPELLSLAFSYLMFYRGIDE